MEWLSTWRQFIEYLVITDETDYLDTLAKHNLTRLNALIKDKAFHALLTKAYEKFHDKVGEHVAQAAFRKFLVNACWICNPGAHFSAPKKNPSSTPDRGDLKKDLQNLTKAANKLATQIQALKAAAGADAYPYLEARLAAGNPVGYILNRKGQWGGAAPRQPVRRLSELLQCFAGDIQEEAVLLGMEIEGRRQKGGKQAGLHFAMDALTADSMRLSPKDPAQPNFALVNRVIQTLMDPPEGFDPGTTRRRYLSSQGRKTPI